MIDFALNTLYLSFIVYNLQTGYSKAGTRLRVLHSAALCELNVLKESSALAVSRGTVWMEQQRA